MHMKWFILLLLLAACTTEVVCPDKYMRFEDGCCLDKDANGVCDRDETKQNTITSAATAVPPLTTSSPAHDLVEALNAENVSKLYHMLTPQLQEDISEEDFVYFYPYLVYGYYEMRNDDGEVVAEGVRENPVEQHVIKTKTDESVVVKELREKGRNTEMTYNLTDKGVKEFEKVVYASCYDVQDCWDDNASLHPMCVQSCEENSYVPLGKEDHYKCKQHKCQCVCWNDHINTGFLVEPTG